MGFTFFEQQVEQWALLFLASDGTMGYMVVNKRAPCGLN
jgi:hypothetical protein